MIGIKRKNNTDILLSVLSFIVCVLIIAGAVLFSSACTGNKPDMTGYIRQINDSLGKGEIETLRENMGSIENPESFEDFYLFAIVSTYDEDYEAAGKYLEKCFSLYTGSDSGLAELNFRQGCVYALQNKWEDAHSCFSEGVDLDDSNAEYWFVLAESDYYTSDYRGAVDSVSKALSLGADNQEELYYLRAKAYFILDDFSSAREDALSCISSNGDYVEYMNFIAACYEAEKDYDGVVDTFMQMIDKGVEDQTIYQNVLNASFKTDNYTVQEIVITRLLQYSTDEETELYLRSCLGTAQLQLNKYKEAESNFNFCLDKNKDDLQLTYQRAVCRVYLMKYDTAYKDFTKLIAADVMTDESHFYRALCKIGTGDITAAEKELQTILDRQENQDMMDAAKLLLEELQNENN